MPETSILPDDFALFSYRRGEVPGIVERVSSVEGCRWVPCIRMEDSNPTLRGIDLYPESQEAREQMEDEYGSGLTWHDHHSQEELQAMFERAQGWPQDRPPESLDL